MTTYTNYKLVRESVYAIGDAIEPFLDAGWKPLGGPLAAPAPYKDTFVQALIKVEGEEVPASSGGTSLPTRLAVKSKAGTAPLSALRAVWEDDNGLVHPASRNVEAHVFALAGVTTSSASDVGDEVVVQRLGHIDDAGGGYLVYADGELYIWDGTKFPPSGDGVTFQGPAGPSGAPGTKGADGKSAYQIWLDAGNSGDEGDFLTSLTAVIRHLSYTDRNDLRAGNPKENAAVLVEGLGLFVYKVSSGEPDDDETCFRIPDKGAWLLQNPHFDLINSYLIGGGQMTTTASYDVTTTAVNISSFGAVTQTFENNIGVQDGDTFIVLPNIEVDSRLSFRAYSDFYRRIKLEVRNNSNSTVSLPAGKVLKVVKYVI